MKPIRVLVVEDNEDHRFFIMRALRKAADGDVELDVVADGADALDFLYQRGPFRERSRPHMILLDLRMPKVSGLEVLAAIKSDPELRTIPVSVLTSSDRPEDIEATYRLGGNSYVVKSSSPEGLQRELADVSTYWAATAVLPEAPA